MLRDYLQPVEVEVMSLLDFSDVFANFESRWAMIKDNHDFEGIGWHRYPGINKLHEEGLQTADIMKSRLAALNDSVLYPDLDSMIECFGNFQYDRNLANTLLYSQSSPIHDVQEQLINLYSAQNAQIDAVYNLLRQIKASRLYEQEHTMPHAHAA